MPTDPTATLLALIDKIGLAGAILVGLCVYLGWGIPKLAVFVKESVDRLLAATETTAHAVTANSQHLADLKAQGAVEVAQHERMEGALVRIEANTTRRAS